MSRLSFHVDVPGLPGGTPLAAELVDTQRSTVQHMPMPVGRATEVSVQPGDYLVQVTLPSGELLDAHVSVAADETKALELRSAATPRSMATPRRRRPRQTSSAARSVLRTRQAPRQRPRDSPNDRYSYEAPRWESPDWDGNALPAPRIGAEHRRAKQKQRAALAGTWVRVWARMGLDEGWQPIRWPGTAIRHRDLEARCSLRLERGRTHMLQVGGVKLPWRLISLPPTPEEIDIVLRPSGAATGLPSSDFDAGVTVTAISRDGAAEVLLSYLTVGRLDAAGTVGPPFLRDAEQLLFEKRRNPMGAAIGGYYLLRMRAEEHLHNWPRNFADWTPWLPDAAVIHSTQLLHQRSVPRTLVRDRLLQAVRAGVPVYTEGLRLLYDALQLFADDARARKAEDEQIDSALEWARPYATAADWQQRLTSFWGASPAAPSLVPMKGRPTGRALGIRTVQAT
jgi:hypothetical protein